MTVADRIAVMDKGELVQVATPGRDLRGRRQSRYVADFIGDVNMLEGRVVERRDGVRVAIDCGTTATSSRPTTPATAASGSRLASRSGRRRSAISHEPPADSAVNAHGGRGLGHRLSRRRLGLPRPARRRRQRVDCDAGQRAPRSSSGRSPGTTRSGSTWPADAGVVLTR